MASSIPPSGSWVALPVKTAQRVTFTEALATFVANEYQTDPAALKEAVSQFTDLRDSCVVRPPEKHDSGYNALAKYYGQLLSLTRRFPFASLEPWNGVLPMPIKMKFAWADLFASGLFAKKTVELCDINFERINVLFNLAALQSEIGALANCTSDDGLKIAFKNFQGAATFFQAVATLIHKHYTTPPTNDLNPTLLQALSQLMLAQAQECFWRKCIVERKSDGVVAKLAKQASAYYEDAYHTLCVRNELDKNWAAIAHAKWYYFDAESQYKQALKDLEDKKYGLAVGRLHVARNLLKKTSEAAQGLSGSYKLDPSSLARAVEEKLAKAEKDNQMIYIEPVPKPEAVPGVEKQSLVSSDKPLPDFTSAEIMGKDPFSVIVPLEVHNAAQRYIGRRDGEIREVIDRLRKATNDSVEALLAMGLPAVLQATENPDTVPQALLDHCNEIRAAGGVPAVEKMIANLPQLAKTCTDMLDDAQHSLDEEQRQDAEYRRKHKDNWQREKSEQIAGPTRAELDKYRTIVQNASNADRTVAGKFDAIRPAILLMSKSEAEVQAALPSGGTSKAANKKAESDLREVLTQLDNLRVERDGLEAEFEKAKQKDDVLPLLLEKGSGAAEESIFDEQMLLYKPLKDRANKAISETEAAMARCSDAYKRFSSGRGSGGEREQMLTDLHAKYEGWKELNKHFNDGTQFYSKLAGLVSQLQVKVRDFCLARQLEATDLLQMIPRTIASTPAEEYRPPVRAPSPPPQARVSAAPPSTASMTRMPSGDATPYSPYAAIPSYGMPQPYGNPAYGYGTPQPGWGAPQPWGPAPPQGPYNSNPYAPPGPYGQPQPGHYNPYGGPR